MVQLMKCKVWEFPGGLVVRTLDFHCREHGSIPSQGTKTLLCSQKKKRKKKKKKRLWKPLSCFTFQLGMRWRRHNPNKLSNQLTTLHTTTRGERRSSLRGLGRSLARLYRGCTSGGTELGSQGLILDTDTDNYWHTPMFQGLFFYP